MDGSGVFCRGLHRLDGLSARQRGGLSSVLLESLQTSSK